MKKNLLNLTVGALLIGMLGATASAQVVVTVGQLDLNAGFNASVGTPGAVSAPVGSMTATHSFTVADLDIAEDGTANDVAVFSYDVTATNGNIGLVHRCTSKTPTAVSRHNFKRTLETAPETFVSPA